MASIDARKLVGGYGQGSRKAVSLDWGSLPFACCLTIQDLACYHALSSSELGSEAGRGRVLPLPRSCMQSPCHFLRSRA